MYKVTPDAWEITRINVSMSIAPKHLEVLYRDWAQKFQINFNHLPAYVTMVQKSCIIVHKEKEKIAVSSTTRI